MATADVSTQSTQTAADILAQDMVVGIFNTHEQAEQVVRQLMDAGIAANHISILARDLQVKEKVEGYVTTGDVARDLAGVGAWTGGLFGLLAGAAFLWIPVVGPLFILGPLATAAVGALEGGAVGGLLGAILGRNMEKQHIPKIQTALEGGKYVVVVHGSGQELELARRIMDENGGQDVTTYPARAAA
ncbi:MAG TPA: general stress protein [Chloroflexota bacterium]|nr:general stress protein [Chloroflexota bacterium]